MQIEIYPCTCVAKDVVDRYGFEQLIVDLHQEVKEVEKAWMEMPSSDDRTSGKRFAEVGMELADVATRAVTMLQAMAEMQRCPSDNFIEDVFGWVAYKNKARGYHDDSVNSF